VPELSNFTTFIRKPYKVEVFRVTDDNLDEVCEAIEGVINEKDGVRFVKTNRRVVRNADRIWPGFYITRVGKKLLAYSPRLFHRNYVEPTEDVLGWVNFLDSLGAPED
jgi:hypothetical protein